MKTRNLFSLSLAAGLIAISGCTTVNSVENANKSGQRNMVADQRAITDGSLNRKVSIVGINTAMTPGGLLQVQVELLNRTRSAQNFIYHFEWFDANGMQINGISAPAISDSIEGGEDNFISAVAPTPACKDFRVKFIEAN